MILAERDLAFPGAACPSFLAELEFVMSFLQSFSARGFAKHGRPGRVPWSNKSGCQAAAGLALAVMVSFVPSAWSGPIYQATGREALQLPQGIEEFERAAASFKQRDYERCFA